ncbi:MAG: hypothetical protein ACXV2I_11855 [Actinomycetes bacterium]
MTTKDDFTDEEWSRIRRAPLVAGLAITLADPGGPIEAAKEAMATIKTAVQPPGDVPLLAELVADLQAMTQHRENPLRDFKLSKDAHPSQQVLDELRAVNETVWVKATPEETAAFHEWLVAVAQAAAEAAKEGGFMGFHAVQVSEGEKEMLAQIRATMGMT